MTFTDLSPGPFNFTHRFFDDDPTGTPGDYVPVSLTITDDDTGLVTANTSVRISNVAPTVVNLSATAINEGQSTNLTGAISNGNVRSTVGTSIFSATQTYATKGVFTTPLTLRDDDIGADSRSSTALITGTAINDRVLQIFTTTGNDRVKVKRRSDLVRVRSRFAPLSRFNYNNFDCIEVCLLEGGTGHDRIRGKSGYDTMPDGPGNDRVHGKSGDNLIDGGADMDLLTGNRGSDVLLGRG